MSVEITEHDSDNEMPELETPETSTQVESKAKRIGGSKQNRMEKKARKAIQKLGMTPFEGINRVTVKKAKGVMFTINEPDVFQSKNSSGTDTFVIFGRADIQDQNAASAQNAAEQFKTASTAAYTPPADVNDIDENDDTISDAGLDPEDIATVMQQGEASRGKAIKALRKHGNIVDAILELSG